MVLSPGSHLINRGMLGPMNPTAWLINAARGPRVDEAALIETLSSGKLEAPAAMCGCTNRRSGQSIAEVAQRGAEPAHRPPPSGARRNLGPCGEAGLELFEACWRPHKWSIRKRYRTGGHAFGPRHEAR